MPTGIVEIQKMLLQNIQGVIDESLSIEKAKVICQQVQTIINVTKFGCELEQRFEKKLSVPVELFETKKPPSVNPISEEAEETEEPIDAKPVEKIRILQPGVTGDELAGRKQIDPKKLDPKTGRPKDQTDPFN